MLNRQFVWAFVLGAVVILVGNVQIKSDDLVRPLGDKPYIDYVQQCIDLLLEYGTDRYGEIETPILVSILDVETRDCPQIPLKLEEKWRVKGRGTRRNPGGANLFTDQPLLRTMYVLSAATGDDGYAQFARTYADYYLKNLIDKDNLLCWGWHRFYDVYEDRQSGDDDVWHEVNAITSINWETLWEVNPQATQTEIEAIWDWHVIDKNTGETDRHNNNRRRGCDFSMNAGAFIKAFVFLYRQTQEDIWLDRAKLLANHYWTKRHPETNFIPERPNAKYRKAGPRFDGSSFTTSITGVFCHPLLKVYEWTGETVFRDQAVTYLKAYAKYGFDKETGKFWGALQLDGTPIPGPRIIGTYAQYEPRGHIDLWEPAKDGYEFPIYTAQAYVYGYQLTKDPELLATAHRFADWIAQQPPSEGCLQETWYQEYATQYASQGTYAEKYGRTISFYLHMYVVTKDDAYLDRARKMADEAISELYHKGLFRGHPAKPYYEAMDGVGHLLYALLQLDLVMQNPQEVLSKQALIVGRENKPMDWDNW